MAHILHTIQIATAFFLIALVLLQRSSTGDMGSTMGDTASFFQTRRGSERFFFILTVIVSVLFTAASLGVIVLAR